ncbi:hypothetical protein ElyMa_001550900 [Elysia marginata]|uniref:Uncharacterized protein n=1 Tax=Elysia marginata TaxID=1093978 RepID=A0AAV4JE11_9GAST|nr:hypothetical protein ElyMa_001550900 [Elysia marginata]
MQRSINQPDSEKSDAAKEIVAHLEQAAKERSLYQYNSVRQKAQNSVSAGSKLKAHEASSFQGVSHYSFDFAQQVLHMYSTAARSYIFQNSKKVWLVWCEC